MSLSDAIVWPPGWRRQAAGGGAIIATGPPRPDGGPPARLEWRQGASSPELEDAVVEDEDRYDLAGHEVGYRRIGHRAGGVELLSEEWRWQVDDEVLVLTGTVPQVDYLAVCDLFEEVAAGVDPTKADDGTAWFQPVAFGVLRWTLSPAARRRPRSASAYGSVRSS